MASEEQFDAVAAAQAQAQAIAAKFAQQQAAGEGAAGGEDFGNNKRKFEDEPVADSAEEDHMRKRASFSGPEAFNGVCASSLVPLKPVDLCLIRLCKPTERSCLNEPAFCSVHGILVCSYKCNVDLSRRFLYRRDHIYGLPLRCVRVARGQQIRQGWPLFFSHFHLDASDVLACHRAIVG